MSRFSLRVAFAVGLLLMLPGRAHAWWDFIEQLSGPGPFYGWDVEVRLFCVVDKVDTGAPAGTPRVLEEDRRMALTVGAVVSACRVKKRDLAQPNIYYVRRLAVDIGARVVWADDNPQFANGQRISLTTLQPTISINLLSKWPDRDFVDYAFGAGAFWFSSSEFPSFSGAFIEPVRLEIHPTTKMKENRWAALIPSVRAGYIMFPAGFETARFAASPDVPPRISRDWVFNTGVFFDLEGLFR
jgi:hypothetical protein